jgi:hypothetical protein
MKITELHINQRVRLHPATDRFMMGDRYATVVRIRTKLVRIKFDRSGHVRYVYPVNLLPIED